MKIRRRSAALAAVLAADIWLAALHFGGAKSSPAWAGSHTGVPGGVLWEQPEDIRQEKSREEAGPVKEGGKTVALTFDDGPNRKYTGELLDGLRERKVRASFFLVGECIEGNEELVRQMDEDGHLIGVHCMKHADLTKEKAEEAAQELKKTGEMIQAITGKETVYMRPPYGSWNEGLGDAVSMEPVFWSVDSLDWKLLDTSRIVKRVLKSTEDGAVILMHDEFSTSLAAAFQIIDNLQANGYTFVTVDEILID